MSVARRRGRAGAVGPTPAGRFNEDECLTGGVPLSFQNLFPFIPRRLLLLLL